MATLYPHYYLLWLADSYIKGNKRQRQAILDTASNIQSQCITLGIPSPITETMLLNACIEVLQKQTQDTLSILNEVFPAKKLRVR